MANHYLSQSLTVAWLIFGSSSTPNLSLATGPVLFRDFFYAWPSPEYRDSLTIAGFRLRRLSQIGIRSAFLHGVKQRVEISSISSTARVSSPLYRMHGRAGMDPGNSQPERLYNSKCTLQQTSNSLGF